jgi:hypothetical protein
MISESAGGLLLPDGSLHRLGQQRGIVPVTSPMERQTFARFHEIAAKYGLAVVCQQCDQSITGQNNDTTQVLSVACGCREWRFTV